jgi:hypothetical protein
MVIVENQKIVSVRKMTDKELEKEGWSKRKRPVVLELEDGTILYPSKDAAGTEAGSLFGYDPSSEESFEFS